MEKKMIDLKLLKTICCLKEDELEQNLVQFLYSNNYKNIIINT